MKKLLIVFLMLFNTLYAEEMTVLLSYDWAPYYSFEGKKQPQGLFIDIIESVAELEGLEIEYDVITSWKRCLKSMEEQRYDAIGPLFKTNERKKYLLYLEENIVYFEENVFVAIDSNIQYNGDLSIMKDLRIGTVLGYSYGEDFDNSEYLRKIPVKNEKQLVKLFSNGDRYDTIVGERFVLIDLLRKSDLRNQYRILEPPFYQAPAYIAFNKNEKKLADKFSKGMKKLKSTSKYDAIINKYLD